jgi:hypothetical protein
MFTTSAICCHMCSHATPVCRGIVSAKQVRARPSAARARQAARLLDKLCALERQRRDNALLGHFLRLSARLSARLVHLGRTGQSARHHEQVGRIHTLQLISTTNPHAARRMASKAAPCSLLHTQCTKTGQGSAADIPVAPLSRLLVKIRALERQRCGNALPDCCLRRARLGARLVHLGVLLNQERMKHVG